MEELRKIYYDPKQGLSSENRLYEKVKHLGYSRKDVKEFIQKQRVNQLHKPVIKRHHHEYLHEY